MKIWTESKVTLVGATATENFPYLFETDVDVSPSFLVEAAGRLCYMSFGKGEADGHKTIQGRVGNKEYIKNILDQKHGSVLEHANFTVLIEGVSRSLTHELVRHRHFSYSQLSQRYVEESNIGFVLPPEIPIDSSMYIFQVWHSSCTASRDRYCELLDELTRDLDHLDIPQREKNKRARQTARSVLPNCTETKIVMTGNARAWIHFFNLRGNIHADTEIRRLAVEIAKLLATHSPNLFQNLYTNQDGTITVEGGSV
jgi:thymidylate synthase (FAD)